MYYKVKYMLGRYCVISTENVDINGVHKDFNNERVISKFFDKEDAEKVALRLNTERGLYVQKF